jgi:hypothetical protein
VNNECRFHNLIREEYEYEKQIVEERLKDWPVSRLRREGFALLDLLVVPKGNLFQEKVYRYIEIAYIISARRSCCCCVAVLLFCTVTLF